MTYPSLTRNFLLALVLAALPLNAGHAQTQPVSADLVYVLDRVEHTVNGVAKASKSGSLERVQRFSEEHPAVKFLVKWTAHDGTFKEVAVRNSIVGAADDPAMIRLGYESDLEITYSTPPRVITPGQAVRIAANWTWKLRIGCARNAGGRRRLLAARLYEMQADRKVIASQKTVGGEVGKLTTEEFKANCRNRTSVNRKGSGNVQLVLEPKQEPPSDMMELRLDGPGSFGFVYHYRLKPRADVRLAEAQPEANAAPDASRACNHDRDIVEIETRANNLVKRGEALKKLMSMSLPELPVLDFCLAASGNSIRVLLKDNDDYYQKMVDFTSFIQDYGGTFGNLVDSADRMMTGAPVNELKSQFTSTFRYFVNAGSDFSSTISTVLNKIRDGTLEQKATSNPEEIVAFINDTVSVLPAVLKTRTQMICAVKSGVPNFYRDMADLEKSAKDLQSRIESDSNCRTGSGGVAMGERLSRLVAQKLLAARKLERWFDEGIIKKPGGGNAGFVARRSWVDERLTATGQSAVLAETNCSAAR